MRPWCGSGSAVESATLGSRCFTLVWRRARTVLHVHFIISVSRGGIPIPQEGLTTLGQTGSLWLDTRRLARQETWGHLGLIKRNYNNYIKITAARAQTIMNTRAIYATCWRPPPPHTHTHTHTSHTHHHHHHHPHGIPFRTAGLPCTTKLAKVTTPLYDEAS